MIIQLDFPTARRDDPATSKKAGKEITVRAGSQRAKILAAYIYGPFTDYEAGQRSGYGDPARYPNCCYWKRCSELRQAGFIEVTGETRRSPAGQLQQICRLTEAGRNKIMEISKDLLLAEAEHEQNDPR